MYVYIQKCRYRLFVYMLFVVRERMLEPKTGMSEASHARAKRGDRVPKSTEWT